jgi:putative ABC transport system permease protein
LNHFLKEGTPTASAGRAASRTRNALIVGEVAVSIVLLAGAGLMLQSLARMLQADRGFRRDHLLTAELDFSVSGFTTWVQPTGTRPQVALRELMTRVRALPGVQAVGAGSRLLRRENRPPSGLLSIFGHPWQRPEEQPKADFEGISPDWLRALGAHLLRGRDFTEADRLEAPGAVLINETLARRYFQNQDPIGQHLRMGDDRPSLGATNHWGQPEWSEIVGVVSDIKSLHPRPETVPEVYQSYWQWPMQNPTLLVRSAVDPTALADAIRQETRSAIPNLPAPKIRTMDQLLSETVAQPRAQTELLSLFAGAALLLATIGLYGVLAYAVTQRRREMGVRMALGARQRDLVSLVVGQGMRLVLMGVVVGLLCAVGLTRVLQSLLYGVGLFDPLTFAAVPLLLITAALIACWLPAWRAARTDPLESLREP